MGKKRHAAHEEHIDETWLIPYADILTLLLALFIVLFSSSQVDEEKFDAMAQALYVAFGGSTTTGSIGGVGPGFNGPDSVELPNTDDLPGDGSDILPVQQLYEVLESYIEANEAAGNFEGNVDVEYTETGVVITLAGDVWFPPGSASLSPAMEDQAEILSSLLVELQDSTSPFIVSVSGHTDNQPITRSRFSSNFELSGTRAYNFMTALLENQNLRGENFNYVGYGEYHPVDTNDTPEGRQRNRRVEVNVTTNVEIELPVNSTVAVSSAAAGDSSGEAGGVVASDVISSPAVSTVVSVVTSGDLTS